MWYHMGKNCVCRSIQSIIGTTSNIEKLQTIAASNVIFVYELHDLQVLVTKSDEHEEGEQVEERAEDDDANVGVDTTALFDPTKRKSNPILVPSLGKQRALEEDV